MHKVQHTFRWIGALSVIKIALVVESLMIAGTVFSTNWNICLRTKDRAALTIDACEGNAQQQNREKHFHFLAICFICSPRNKSEKALALQLPWKSFRPSEQDYQR